MGLVAVRIEAGNAFRIYVLEEDEKCGLLEFLDEIQLADRDRLQRYFEWTANQGIIKNRKIFKKLDDKIHEFKTRGGVRVLCFFDSGGIIVLTNGCVKKKDDLNPQEITRAKLWKAKYDNAKANNTLKRIDE